MCASERAAGDPCPPLSPKESLNFEWVDSLWNFGGLFEESRSQARERLPYAKYPQDRCTGRFAIVWLPRLLAQNPPIDLATRHI